MSLVVQYGPTHRNAQPLKSSLESVAINVAFRRQYGRLSSEPFHDFVESLKIGTRFPVGKKFVHLQSGQV